MVNFYFKNKIKPIVVYTSIIAFISIWWSLAFIVFYKESQAEIVDISQVQVHKNNLSPFYISQLNREKIQDALSGNASLMTGVIAMRTISLRDWLYGGLER